MTNIIIIGPPGAGKSTAGQALAEQLGCEFIDTDKLIEADQGKSLQAILDSEGYKVLRDIEQRCLLSINPRNAVIATGGSAVYSEAAMQHLRHTGVTVFLKLGFEHLLERVQNFEQRGLARPKNQSLQELYEERLPRYQRYADITINCDGLTLEELVDSINENARPLLNSN